MEIKANEFRRGNTLEITSGIKEQCVVLSISDTHIVYETKSRKGEAVLSCFKPIELTEELLLKCGIDNWINSTFEIRKNIDNTFTIYAWRKGKDIFICHIMYLHDLQNWHYLHFNKTELQITL